MRVTPVVLLFAVAPSMPGALVSQEVTGRPGPRILLPRDQEVALARSAAPPSVHTDARVWVFTNGRYVVADSGTSGVECYVGRGWPEALEPHCFDEEGAGSVMRMAMRRSELLHAGTSAAAADAEIAAGLASGTYRLPRRPAMSWMMSSAQVLYNDSGQRVGAWRPHVMIYFPYLSADAVGTGANNDLRAGIVVSSGTPVSNLMIVVPEAVDPAPARTTPDTGRR